MAAAKRRTGMIRAAVIAFLIFIMAQCSVAVFAAPKVKKTEYEGRGRVEVDFFGKVKYKNVKVTVKDGAGRKYTARIVEKDNDDLTFVIVNFRKGAKYTYQISGIRAMREQKFGTVKGTVSIPKPGTSLTVKKVKYDREDRELDIEFASKITVRKPSVTISDGTRTYKAVITDRDDDEIEVRVSGLVRGRKYSYTISGISKRGSTAAPQIKGSFVA